jgi:hypothetical protein
VPGAAQPKPNVRKTLDTTTKSALTASASKPDRDLDGDAPGFVARYHTVDEKRSPPLTDLPPVWRSTLAIPSFCRSGGPELFARGLRAACRVDRSGGELPDAPSPSLSRAAGHPQHHRT